MDRDSIRTQTHPVAPPRAPQKCRDRERSYQLSDEEFAAMRIVGSFRAVNANDVPTAEVEHLADLGMLERKTVSLHRGKDHLNVVVLTGKGRRLLEDRQQFDDLQRFHVGLVKPNEMAHDTEMYPAYKRAAEAIEEAGGKVERVVLDFELKAQINSEMNRRGGRSQEERRSELGRDFALPIVNGRLSLPDVRIEYVDAEGRPQHQDLEIVTKHYKGAHLAGKKASGFKLVQAGGSRAAVHDDHRIGWL